MSKYKDLFCSHLDEIGIKYTDINEFWLSINYPGDKLKSIPVAVLFDEDGYPLVQIRCWEIVNAGSKKSKFLEICNQLNAENRWVKFFVDDQGDLTACFDARIDESNCGEHCLEYFLRIARIVDEVYPQFIYALV